MVKKIYYVIAGYPKAIKVTGDNVRECDGIYHISEEISDGEAPHMFVDKPIYKHEYKDRYIYYCRQYLWKYQWRLGTKDAKAENDSELISKIVSTLSRM